MQCNECGSTNAAGTRFCTRCGSALSGGAAGGVRRETAAEPGLFGGPAPPPMPPPMGSRPPSGAVRRTALDDGPAGPPAIGAPPQAPPPLGASHSPASGRHKTQLEESGPTSGGGPGVVGGTAARIVGWMVSYDHNASGQDYVIRAGKTRIGRGRDNEVSLFFEGKASDLHCTLIWRAGQISVKDEGSTNGTSVNGEDIGIAGVQPLQHGDMLTVGGSTFQVFLISSAVAARVWPASPWGKP